MIGARSAATRRTAKAATRISANGIRDRAPGDAALAGEGLSTSGEEASPNPLGVAVDGELGDRRQPRWARIIVRLFARDHSPSLSTGAEEQGRPSFWRGPPSQRAALPPPLCPLLRSRRVAG